MWIRRPSAMVGVGSVFKSRPAGICDSESPAKPSQVWASKNMPGQVSRQASKLQQRRSGLSFANHLLQPSQQQRHIHPIGDISQQSHQQQVPNNINNRPSSPAKNKHLVVVAVVIVGACRHRRNRTKKDWVLKFCSFFSADFFALSILRYLFWDVIDRAPRSLWDLVWGSVWAGCLLPPSVCGALCGAVRCVLLLLSRHYNNNKHQTTSSTTITMARTTTTRTKSNKMMPIYGYIIQLYINNFYI